MDTHREKAGFLMRLRGSVTTRATLHSLPLVGSTASRLLSSGKSHQSRKHDTQHHFSEWQKSWLTTEVITLLRNDHTLRTCALSVQTTCTWRSSIYIPWRPNHEPSASSRNHQSPSCSGGFCRCRNYYFDHSARFIRVCKTAPSLQKMSLIYVNR